MRLAWIDLETAGLDPRFHPILEIALVITDSNLEELVHFATVVRPEKRWAAAMGEAAQAMHKENGILDAIAEGKGMSTKLAEATVATMLEAHTIASGEKLYLAGSGVHFDRKFLERQMPEVAKLLHYKNLDVSTLRTIAATWGRPDMVQWTKNDTHRAYEDVRDAINEFAYYQDVLLQIER